MAFLWPKAVNFMVNIGQKTQIRPAATVMLNFGRKTHPKASTFNHFSTTPQRNFCTGSGAIKINSPYPMVPMEKNFGLISQREVFSNPNHSICFGSSSFRLGNIIRSGNPNPNGLGARSYHKSKSSNTLPKMFRGRMKGICDGGNHLAFGKYALQALEPAWITARQIEAARRAILRNTPKSGKIWVRVFPYKTVTSKPAEVRMGRGKGAIQYSVAVVKPGRLLYELGGVTESTAKKAIEIASSKMPIRTKFVSSG